MEEKTWCGCRGKVLAVRYLLLQQDARPLHICGRTDYSIEWLRVIVSWLCDNIKLMILLLSMDNKIGESRRNIYVSSKKPSPVEAFMETFVEKSMLVNFTSWSPQEVSKTLCNVLAIYSRQVYVSKKCRFI